MRFDITNIKKSFLLALLIVFVIIVAVLAAAVTLMARNELTFRNPVRILQNPLVTWAVPEAEVTKIGTERWREIETGQKLNESHSLRTGPYGNVDIRFDGGTVIHIAENSFASLGDLSLSNVDLNLTEGRLVSRFRKLTGHETHKVTTPTAVCGIRGTELIFDVSEGQTVIYGMSGHTEVASQDFPDSPILLGFQQKTAVSEGALPASPVEMSPEEVAYFRRLLDSLHDSVVLLVTTSLSFKPDSAELTQSAMEELTRIAKTLKKTGADVEIAGHTADVGDRASQYTLSVQRAEQVRLNLISEGVKGRRLSVKGYGGSKPIADNATPEGRSQNRRVEFLFN